VDVSGHDGDSAGVDGAQVGVFEKSNEVSFGGFLEGKDCTALEPEFLLEIVGDFTDKSLERQLADEEFGALLVFSDFTESDCSWSEFVGFLDSTCGWGTLSGSLSGQVLTGGFCSG